MILSQLRMGARQAKNVPLLVSVSYNFSLHIHLGHPQSLNNSIRCLSWDLTRVAKYWSESKSVPIKTFESASTLKPLENRKLPIFLVWNRYYETYPIIPGFFFKLKQKGGKLIGFIARQSREVFANWIGGLSDMWPVLLLMHICPSGPEK